MAEEERKKTCEYFRCDREAYYKLVNLIEGTAEYYCSMPCLEASVWGY